MPDGVRKRVPNEALQTMIQSCLDSIAALLLKAERSDDERGELKSDHRLIAREIEQLSDQLNKLMRIVLTGNGIEPLGETVRNNSRSVAAIRDKTAILEAKFDQHIKDQKEASVRVRVAWIGAVASALTALGVALVK